MIFKSPVVVKYILSGANLVATIRDCGYYSTKVGKGVLLKLGDQRLRGKVLKVVGLDMAREFVAFSGFSTVEEWLNEARRLHRREDLSGFCIVVVELVK